MLERYKCQTPYHAVRTHFIGRIASPAEKISPIETIKQLWGGELPAFDNLENFNELLHVLIDELWNQLTKHQTPANPFRLTRIKSKLEREDLRNFARVRQQEIEGFIEGVFGRKEELDLPENAHKAANALGEMRGILAGAASLLDDDSKPSTLGELKDLIYNFQEISKIAESEINAAILSCRRARDHGGTRASVNNPTRH